MRQYGIQGTLEPVLQQLLKSERLRFSLNRLLETSKAF